MKLEDLKFHGFDLNFDEATEARQDAGKKHHRTGDKTLKDLKAAMKGRDFHTTKTLKEQTRHYDKDEVNLFNIATPDADTAETNNYVDRLTVVP
jgi:hypothetical protein